MQRRKSMMIRCKKKIVTMMSLTAIFNGCLLFYFIFLESAFLFPTFSWGMSRHTLDVALAHSRPVAHAPKRTVFSLCRFPSGFLPWGLF